uniref:Uncharacterized protein n=1 Tax=Ditylenchus dipsaci TaxID=166011 RepID=A0A915ERV0_9BILA
MGSENSKSANKGGSGGGNTPEGATITTRQTNDTNGSANSRNIGLPPAIKVGNSISCNENLLGAGLPQQTDTKLTIDNTRSRSAVLATLLSSTNTELFSKPHENLGRRILKRTAEKRKDFGRFYLGLNGEQKDDVEDTIKTLLKKSVANVEFMDEVQRLAEEFGERFVQYRTLSFKADYFSSIADATITECVFLDNAVHPAHLTLSAFSQFITALFSSVRDGFYNEMKRLRRTSNSFSTGSNGSARREKKASIDSSREATPSPRSGTPEVESISHNSQGSSVEEVLPPAPSPAIEEKIAKEPEKPTKAIEKEAASPGNGMSLTNTEVQEARQETVLEENAKEVVQKTIIDSFLAAPKEVVDKVIYDTTNKVTIIDSTCGPREAVQKVIIDSIIVDSVNPGITSGSD